MIACLKLHSASSQLIRSLSVSSPLCCDLEGAKGLPSEFGWHTTRKESRWNAMTEPVTGVCRVCFDDVGPDDDGVIPCECMTDGKLSVAHVSHIPCFPAQGGCALQCAAYSGESFTPHNAC